MKENIFLYKLLLNLKHNDLENIDINVFLDLHPFFLDLLDNYDLTYYRRKFKNYKKFRNNLLLVFMDFEMGIYQNNTIIFTDDNNYIDLIFDYELNDVYDSIINNIGNELAILIKDMNNKRQLTF